MTSEKTQGEKMNHSRRRSQIWMYFDRTDDTKAQCSECKVNVSYRAGSTSNLHRHMRNVHQAAQAEGKGQDGEPAKKRAKKIMGPRRQRAAAGLAAQPTAKATTVASYRISHVLAGRGVSLRDGGVVKEALMEAAEALFSAHGGGGGGEVTAAIGKVQLTPEVVTRRCEEMAANVELQLKQDIEDCDCFSLQFDETTDMMDTAQLCVFIRMVFFDMSTKEELLTILPLDGLTQGEDMYNAFLEFVNKTELPLFKLISITTNGAPAMMDQPGGFIALCRQNESFPDVLHYHCVIHQQALFGAILNMKDVMDVAMKIVCSVRARSLQRRLFWADTERAGTDHTDLLLHTDLRWLCRGKFLVRFFELLPEIKDFLSLLNPNESFKLDDAQWLLDFSFLTDLTVLLSELNLELQGRSKNVIHIISSVSTFKSRLQLLSNRLQRGDLRSFPHLQAELHHQEQDVSQLDTARYHAHVQSILSEFERRFTDFASIEPVTSYMCYPFSACIDVDDIVAKLLAVFQLDGSAVENEILALQNDIEIKSRATPGMNGEFWSLLSEEKYPNLRRVALNLTALFGSTYLCESTYSHMNIMKTKHRATMTDSHLLTCLRLATSSYRPSYENLASSCED